MQESSKCVNMQIQGFKYSNVIKISKEYSLDDFGSSIFLYMHGDERAFMV